MADSRHGGDIYRNDIALDFSVNVNPLGLPKGVREALRAGADHWDRYPDPECGALAEAVAERLEVPKEALLFGNGAAELIYRLAHALRPKRALLPAPTFSEYERALRSVDCEVRYVYLSEPDGFVPDMGALRAALKEGADILFFCNPNNPTGILSERAAVEELAEMCRKKGTFLAVDECFCELADAPEKASVADLAARDPGILVLRAFTKTYGMAGLRLGYAVCGNRELLRRMKEAGQPWNVSLPAQEAGIAALFEKEYLAKARKMIARERPVLAAALRKLGYTVYDSAANYLFFRDEKEAAAGEPSTAHGRLYETCLARRILIRDCSNYEGLGPGYYRVCVRGPEENQMLIAALSAQPLESRLF